MDRSTTKMNEAFVKSIIQNCDLETAVKRIADAITNRDVIISLLKTNQGEK